MQYIITTYHGPTHHRDSRIIAKTSGGKMSETVYYNYAKNTETNHHLAAETLAKKLKWPGKWIAGSGEDGNVYVCCPALIEGNGFIVDPQ